MKDTVPLRFPYSIDLKTVRWVRFVCGGCGARFEMLIADCWENNPIIPVTWLPISLLDIFPAIPTPPKPDSWVPVKENKVQPVRTLGKLV